MFFSFETYEFHDDLVDCLSWKIWYLKRILFEDFVAVLLFEGWRGAENWCSLQEIGALFILAEATVWDGTMGWNEIATVNHKIAPAFIIIIDHDHDRRVLVGRADVHSNVRVGVWEEWRTASTSWSHSRGTRRIIKGWARQTRQVDRQVGSSKL